MHHHHSSRLRQIAAIAAMSAIAFVGCNDDGTPRVTIDEETYEDIGLAATDIAARGAIAPFLLIQLGYFALDGPPTATAPATATGSRLPSAGMAPEDFCDFGSVTVEISEDDDSATVDYHACLFNAGGPDDFCFVDGRIELGEATLDGEGAVRVEATDLVVDCEELGGLNLFDGDNATCSFDGPPSLEGCEINLAEFEGAASEATLRVPEIQVFGSIFGGSTDVIGTGVDVDLGKFDFESVEELEFDCSGLPSAGVILFGDEDSGDYGSIEFDESCEEFEVCLWPEDEGPEIECTFTDYPGEPLDI